MVKLSEFNPGAHAFVSNKYVTGLQSITINRGNRGGGLEFLGEMNYDKTF